MSSPSDSSPLRWPLTTAVAGGMIGGILPNLLGHSQQHPAPARWASSLGRPCRPSAPLHAPRGPLLDPYLGPPGGRARDATATPSTVFPGEPIGGATAEATI
jgi:hypothetical protein